MRVAAELAEWDCKLAAVVGGPRQAARALERLFMTSLYPVLERLGSSSLLVAQAANTPASDRTTTAALTEPCRLFFCGFLMGHPSLRLTLPMAACAAASRAMGTR